MEGRQLLVEQLGVAVVGGARVCVCGVCVCVCVQMPDARCQMRRGMREGQGRGCVSAAGGQQGSRKVTIKEIQYRYPWTIPSHRLTVCRRPRPGI